MSRHTFILAIPGFILTILGLLLKRPKVEAVTETELDSGFAFGFPLAFPCYFEPAVKYKIYMPLIGKELQNDSGK